MATESSREIAAQIWCRPECSQIEMDVTLAEAFAEVIDKYREALQWCGGSSDFAPGGLAHKGWMKLCHPLL